MSDLRPAPRPADRSVGALWASAFVLAGLVLTVASGLPRAQSQTAGTVSTVGELTVLTAPTGAGEDVIIVLDGISESVFVYGMLNRNAIEIHQTYDLHRLFTDARSGAGLPARP